MSFVHFKTANLWSRRFNLIYLFVGQSLTFFIAKLRQHNFCTEKGRKTKGIERKKNRLPD